MDKIETTPSWPQAVAARDAWKAAYASNELTSDQKAAAKLAYERALKKCASELERGA